MIDKLNNRTLKHSNNGTMEQWNNGTQYKCYVGIEEPWKITTTE